MHIPIYHEAHLDAAKLVNWAKTIVKSSRSQWNHASLSNLLSNKSVNKVVVRNTLNKKNFCWSILPPVLIYHIKHVLHVWSQIKSQAASRCHSHPITLLYSPHNKDIEEKFRRFDSSFWKGNRSLKSKNRMLYTVILFLQRSNFFHFPLFLEPIEMLF